ncbi:unnamed protein product [Rhizophagus irregularis]|nr:unnamed protein product [Rhizophagus irregularis]
MWKAYKVIHTSYYQDVARKNYTFEYGKTTRFGEKTVFLAYFKSRQQLEDAIASDANEENKWMIHGRRLDNVLRSTLKPSGLVSTVPNKNVDTTKSVNKIEEKSTATSPIVGETITTTEEEVVDTVNKYRKDCLDDKYRGYFKDQATWDKYKYKYGKCQAIKEEQASRRLPPLQNYATLEDIVKVIKEYREETSVMSGPAIVEEAILVDLSDPKEGNVEMDKEEERIKVPETKENKEKIVSPVEWYEYTKVNADCAKRLQNESEEDYIKEVKKRVKKKQGTRSESEGYTESEEETNDVEVKVED